MHEDPEDLVRIIERDIRLERPNRDDVRSPEGSPDSVEGGQQPEHAEQPVDQQGMDAQESDVEDHVLYGPEEDPRTAHTPSSSSGTRHERPSADEEVTDTKRRRLLGVMVLGRSSPR